MCRNFFSQILENRTCDDIVESTPSSDHPLPRPLSTNSCKNCDEEGISDDYCATGSTGTNAVYEMNKQAKSECTCHCCPHSSRVLSPPNTGETTRKIKSSNLHSPRRHRTTNSHSHKRNTRARSRSRTIHSRSRSRVRRSPTPRSSKRMPNKHHNSTKDKPRKRGRTKHSHRRRSLSRDHVSHSKTTKDKLLHSRKAQKDKKTGILLWKTA